MTHGVRQTLRTFFSLGISYSEIDCNVENVEINKKSAQTFGEKWKRCQDRMARPLVGFGVRAPGAMLSGLLCEIKIMGIPPRKHVNSRRMCLLKNDCKGARLVGSSHAFGVGFDYILPPRGSPESMAPGVITCPQIYNSPIAIPSPLP